jgi:hypothetical protein
MQAGDGFLHAVRRAGTDDVAEAYLAGSRTEEPHRGAAQGSYRSRAGSGRAGAGGPRIGTGTGGPHREWDGA